MGYGAARHVSTPPSIRLTGTATLGDAVLFGPIDLEIPSAQWTCLLGVSGAGKTTVLRYLAGLETGAAMDATVSASDAAPLPDRIAYMAQSDLLMPWLNVEENVLLGARLRGQADAAAQDRARDLIAQVGLAGDIAKRPKHLSGGMRQRVALARTLMEDRPVILLDEPFSALDAKTRSEMQELAFDLLAGRTVLLVTHDPAEAARLGHSIHVLQNRTLTTVDVPSTDPIRSHDSPAVFACQSELMNLIREAA